MLINSKQVARLIFPAMLCGMLLMAACENDLNKIKEISAQQISLPVDTFRGVEMLLSDSAKVKGKLITSLLINHTTDSPYNVMPNGVKVIFYENGIESGNIVSDSAVRRERQGIVEFHRNVVATNAQGETFKSEELIWDEIKQIIYSNKSVQVTTKGGDVINGVNFMSDDKLNNPVFNQGTGVIMVTDSTMH